MIIKIPYTDGEHKGCAKGADAIVDQLQNIWTNSYHRKTKTPKIEECSIKNIKDAKIYLGGDHTITYYTVKHFVKKNKNTAFLVFDAHPDVFQQFDKPTHLDYLKFLIEENILKPEDIFLVGIRAAHKDEIKYLKEKGVRFLSPQDTDLEAACDGIMEFLRKYDSVYVSIDMDAIDPAFAPGVSYIEPCGLTSREILYFTRRLKKLKNLKAIDIVEVNPDNDINNMTAKLAAKLVAEFL
jgi:arginase family enzyme